MIKYKEVEEKEVLLPQLLRVWESAVRATHLFLSEKEIEKIKRYVPQAIGEVPFLVVAEQEGMPVAFAGIKGQKLEMLFVSAENRGKGIGKRLLQYAVDNHGVSEVVVNEQNAQAAGFYLHAGFVVCKRSDVDEQGNPYPILYMKRV